MSEEKAATGRAKGGIARREKLSPERRSEIARNAANTRHALSRPLEAIRRGNFITDFGIDAECYVLNDDRKTAVMTQRSIGAALGLSNPGGNDFVRLVSGKVLSTYIGAEVLSKIMEPIEFKWVYPGADSQKQPSKDTARTYLLTLAMQFWPQMQMENF